MGLSRFKIYIRPEGSTTMIQPIEAGDDEEFAIEVYNKNKEFRPNNLMGLYEFSDPFGPPIRKVMGDDLV